MTMRKLFAGIAAAATLLGGMALGAAGAQAADTSTQPGIKVNHSVAGHTYTAYQFATFANASTSGDTSTVEIETVAAYADAVKTAADAADDDTVNNSVPAEYFGNPAAYAATFSADQLRKFADGLKSSLTGNGAAQVSGDGQTVNLPVSEGWYAVADTYQDAEGVNQSGTVAIVATKVNNADKLAIKTPYEAGQTNIDKPGEFNAKNEDVPPTPVKEVKKGDASVNGKSVNIGDVLDFTVTGTVPSAAVGYSTYRYTITDTASKGLKVGEASAFKVTTEGSIAIDSSKYAVTVTPNSETGQTVTTIVFANAQEYAGQKIIVSYQATVTDGILDNLDKATNKAQAATDKGESGIGETTVYVGVLKFHKYGVDSDARGLAGATFNVYAGTTVPQKAGADDTSQALKFTATARNTAGSDVDGSYKYDAATGAIAVESGKNGDVVLKGLAAGDYTIKEVGFKDGYATNFVPTFTVTVSVDQQTGAVTYVLKQGANNALGLVSTGDEGQINVKNVKSITQLPLTGAAGTAMFAVIAVLLAGVAAAVYAKSRSTKRMLNA